MRYIYINGKKQKGIVKPLLPYLPKKVAEEYGRKHERFLISEYYIKSGTHSLDWIEMKDE